jgi:hypothetical protein
MSNKTRQPGFSEKTSLKDYLKPVTALENFVLTAGIARILRCATQSRAVFAKDILKVNVTNEVQITPLFLL